MKDASRKKKGLYSINSKRKVKEYLVPLLNGTGVEVTKTRRKREITQ